MRAMGSWTCTVAPTSGAAFVHGLEVARHPLEIKRHLAYIPENVMLYPHLTGLENLALFSSLAGFKYCEGELRDYLAQGPTQAELDRAKRQIEGKR